MLSKEEINIEDIMRDINKQIWRFEQKYHIRPSFIKCGTYVDTILKQMTNTNFRYLDTERGYLKTFMGLIICDTPMIEDFSVEVF